MVRYGIIFTLTLLVSAGCGRKAAEKIAETAIERAAEADGKPVDVDFGGSDGTMTIKSADGEITYQADADAGSMEIQTPEGSLVAGEKAKVPDDFPEDVPLYEDFKPQMVQQTGAKGSFMLSGTLNASISDVQTFYNKQAVEKGWEQTTSLVQPPMVMLVYQKDQRILQINAAQEDDGTQLTVTVVAQ